MNNNFNVKLSNGFEVCHGEIVNTNTKEVITKFKTISNAPGEGNYLLELDDGKMILIKFSDNNKIYKSEPFYKLIYYMTYNNGMYALVSKKNGRRFLICFLTASFLTEKFRWDSKFIVMSQYGTNKKVILNSTLKPYIIDSADKVELEYYNSSAEYIIVSYIKENKKMLLRINDFKKSKPYYSFIYLYLNDKRMPSTKYVIVKTKTHEIKYGIMKIDNFELSKLYDSIKVLSDNHILVIENNKELVMRLNDFSVAEFKG